MRKHEILDYFVLRAMPVSNEEEREGKKERREKQMK
jgi:hypothetical protein